MWTGFGGGKGGYGLGGKGSKFGGFGGKGPCYGVMWEGYCPRGSACQYEPCFSPNQAYGFKGAPGPGIASSSSSELIEPGCGPAGDKVVPCSTGDAVVEDRSDRRINVRPASSVTHFCA